MGPVNSHRPPLYFLVSYAHADPGEDELVRQFFTDLLSEVRLFSTLRDDRVGFLDTTVRVGDQWSPTLMDALARCQTFVALCSRAYFARDACGKEWAVFTRRLAAYERETGGAAPSLIPLFWVHDLAPMPPALSSHQYHDHRLGAAYRENGVRDLVRLVRLRDDYQLFVSALARRVVELVERYRIPPHQRLDFAAIDAAFPHCVANAADSPKPDVAHSPQAPVSPPTQPTVDGSGELPILNPNDGLRPPPRRTRRRTTEHHRSTGLDDR